MPGSIRKRSRDSWTVIVSYRDPASGKLRQLWRAVRGTKKQAEKELVRLLSERDGGMERPSGRQTVAEYLERWLRDYAEASLAPSTLAHYRRSVRKVFVP